MNRTDDESTSVRKGSMVLMAVGEAWDREAPESTNHSETYTATTMYEPRAADCLTAKPILEEATRIPSSDTKNVLVWANFRVSLEGAPWIFPSAGI